jgi:hypothetical protein
MLSIRRDLPRAPKFVVVLIGPFDRFKGLVLVGNFVFGHSSPLIPAKISALSASSARISSIISSGSRNAAS